MSAVRGGAIREDDARPTWIGRALVAALLLVAGLGVARTRGPLAAIAHTIKPRDDIYALPPPAELRAMSLGHRAAAADLLWSKLLVEYGVHWAERRPFLDIARYADAILALEPDYPPLYAYIGTLLVYRPPQGTEEDARHARGFLDRGIRVRPTDYRRWTEYGQFVAFIGPSFLQAPSEKERWRREGAEALARAVELGEGADRSLTAATLLGRAGERRAAIRYLRRAFALADDETTRDEIGAKLRELEARAEEEAARENAREVETRWQRDYPFLSRGMYLLLGPSRDAARCAGRGAPTECGGNPP
jgi:hypothetical protein